MSKKLQLILNLWRKNLPRFVNRDSLSQAGVETSKQNARPGGLRKTEVIKRGKRMPGELARDAGLSSEEEIGRVMKNVFDRLQHAMSTRTFFTTRRPELGFLLDVKTLLSDYQM